jgi:glycosyltransferase involved in cell wall biosynthesis
LHQAIQGEEGAEPMLALIRQYQLKERVFLNPLAEGVVSDDDLNLLYNACDVGINTAMGEGWGLVSFEHAATGAPQVVPDHTACREIWRGHGELIPLAKSYIPEFSVLEMGEVSVDGVAQALENLYCNPNHHQQLSQIAFSVTQRSEFSWDSIPQQFENLFVELTD